VGQVLKGIYAPQRASDAQVEKEMARLMRSPDSLLSMVDVSRGEPSLLLKQLAPQIRCKILIVHGENDAVVPVRCARSLYATLSPDHPGARLRVLPGAGHMLALYQADQCARLIVDFAS
jgi:pimeloyl-ACP methyl ester carboxylesterase